MGKHPCIAWILILWGKCRDLFTKHNKGKDNAPPLVELSEVDEEIKEGPIPDLPFDIITNILIRLPAKCIFRLWHQINSNDDDVLYNLTADPCFTRTHLDRGRATPTIAVKFIEQSVDNDIKLFNFDDKAENVEETSLDLSSWNAYCMGHPVDLWGSYDGFLLFRSGIGPAHFCIWNPITKEQVTVTFPSILFYVCGFYFYPRKKEYEVVSACTCYYNGSCARNDFQILSLRTKHRRSVGSCPFPPCTKRPPVFINGIFYWMVDCFGYLMQNGVHPSLSDSILSFNIATEEFNTVEAVAPSNDDPHKRYPGNVFKLFESEGDLAYLILRLLLKWSYGCLTTVPNAGIKNTQ